MTPREYQAVVLAGYDQKIAEFRECLRSWGAERVGQLAELLGRIKDPSDLEEFARNLQAIPGGLELLQTIIGAAGLGLATAMMGLAEELLESEERGEGGGI